MCLYDIIKPFSFANVTSNSVIFSKNRSTLRVYHNTNNTPHNARGTFLSNSIGVCVQIIELPLTHYIMVVFKYLPVPLLYPFTGLNGFSLKNRPGIECLMFIAIVWLRNAVQIQNALKPFIEVNCFLVVCLCPHSHSLVLGFCKFAIMQNAVLVRQAAGA